MTKFPNLKATSGKNSTRGKNPRSTSLPSNTLSSPSARTTPAVFDPTAATSTKSKPLEFHITETVSVTGDRQSTIPTVTADFKATGSHLTLPKTDQITAITEETTAAVEVQDGSVLSEIVTMSLTSSTENGAPFLSVFHDPTANATHDPTAPSFIEEKLAMTPITGETSPAFQAWDVSSIPQVSTTPSTIHISGSGYSPEVFGSGVHGSKTELISNGDSFYEFDEISGSPEAPAVDYPSVSHSPLTGMEQSNPPDRSQSNSSQSASPLVVLLTEKPLSLPGESGEHTTPNPDQSLKTTKESEPFESSGDEFDTDGSAEFPSTPSTWFMTSLVTHGNQKQTTSDSMTEFGAEAMDSATGEDNLFVSSPIPDAAFPAILISHQSQLDLAMNTAASHHTRPQYATPGEHPSTTSTGSTPPDRVHLMVGGGPESEVTVRSESATIAQVTEFRSAETQNDQSTEGSGFYYGDDTMVEPSS